MKTNELKPKTSTHAGVMKRLTKAGITAMLIFSGILLSTGVSLAHCDTMDGPVAKDALLALEKNNINYVLKWIKPESEAELKEVFNLAGKVRKLGTEAGMLSDRYFIETLVRLHRSGEGVPFTGVKPAGTPVDERIAAADKAIEKGDLSPLKDLVPAGILPELTERFEKVLSLKNFNVDNVEAGREYVEAYVRFFKFAEGEEENHNGAHEHTTDIHIFE